MRIKELYEKLRFHLLTWNRWRKLNVNSRWHKILVLLGLRESASLESTKRAKLIFEGLKAGLKGEENASRENNS